MPQSSQKAPARAPTRFQNQHYIANFFKNVDNPLVKPLFLRVGGSAWELNVDPRRLRKKRNNDIEKRRTKRDEEKSIENDKKGSKKL